MQFRFVELKGNDANYSLLGYCDIADYDVAFKTFTFMKEHECEWCITFAEMVEEGPDVGAYEVVGINFVSPKVGTDLLPHFVVEVRGL